MKKIALVIGHRSGSQGAYGSNGVSEYRFYNELLKEITPIISDIVDARVFERTNKLSGYGERMEELHERIDAWGADISISFHFNGFSNPTVDGHEVLYCSKKGRVLSEKMNNIFSENLNNRNRGIKKVYLYKNDDGAGFVCRGKSICILIEPFFASNINDYMSGDGREMLIKSIVEFIKEVSV